MSNLKPRFQRQRVSRSHGQYSRAVGEPLGGDESLFEQVPPLRHPFSFAEFLAVPAMPLPLTVRG